MKLELKIQLLRFCSALLNTVFLVLGVSVGGCGVWLLFDTASLLTAASSVELKTIAFGLMVIGGVVVSVSVVGCIGANGEHRLLLLIYEGLLIILVLGQLFVTVLLLINRNKVEQSLDTAVDQLIHRYGDSSNTQDKLMDNVQRDGACCGRTGPADWLDNSIIVSLNLSGSHVLPCSCFSSYRRSFNSSWCCDDQDVTMVLCGRGNGSYIQGCKEKLSDWLQENLLTIVGMDVSLMLIQVLQGVVSFSLYRAFVKKDSLRGSSQLTVPDGICKDPHNPPNCQDPVGPSHPDDPDYSQVQ